MFKYKINIAGATLPDDSVLQGGNALEGIYKPKEVNNPEKIYATLQECRDTVGIKKTEGISYMCETNQKLGVDESF